MCALAQTSRGWVSETFLCACLCVHTLRERTDEGIIVVMANEVARRAGFNWRDNYAVLPAPSGDKTYTEWLAYSIQEYDVVANWYLQTAERMNFGASFPQASVPLSIYTSLSHAPLCMACSYDYWTIWV